MIEVRCFQTNSATFPLSASCVDEVSAGAAGECLLRVIAPTWTSSFVYFLFQPFFFINSMHVRGVHEQRVLYINTNVYICPPAHLGNKRDAPVVGKFDRRVSAFYKCLRTCSLRQQ